MIQRLIPILKSRLHIALLSAVVAFIAAGPARAQMSNVSPVNDLDFVKGLLELNLGSLVPQLLKQPPSNPAEAAGLRDALVDAWLPSLRDDPDAYAAALDQLFAYSDRLFQQPEYKDYWGRACWASDFAQHLMLAALPDLYQAGDFALLGFPNATQRRMVDIIAARSFKMLERAEDEHYRLASILRAQPDFTTDYVNTGYWDKMQEYVAFKIPYYRAWAAIYLLTQSDTGPYFKQFADPKAQRAKLIAVATSDTAAVLAAADQRQLSDDTLVMIHLAAADIALAAGKNDAANEQSIKALTYKDAQPYTNFLAQLTRTKVMQYTGKPDEMQPILRQVAQTEIALSNPLNQVLCADRMFDMDYQRALASSDPANQRDLMNRAFEVYMGLMRNPALGQWKSAIEQFVEARYPQQIPPGLDASNLPPPVRFAAVRRAFDDGEAARQAGDAAQAKANFDQVEKLTADLLKQPDLSKDLEVETRFYLGFAQLRGNKAGYAMQTFTQLADKFPDTQRGEQAIGVAVVTLGKPLYTGAKDNSTIQQLYAAAMNVLFEKYPNTELARLSTYDYAAFLREQEKYQQAVEAYDRVPENHPAYLDARYERLACLGAQWAQAPVDQKSALATELLRGVDDFNKLASAQLPQLTGARKEEIRKDVAGALLLNASVYIETTNQPDQARKVIDEVTSRFGDLTDLTTRMIGLKIRIFQRQGNYAGAEALLQQYMQQAPDKAGPLGLGVLQSLNTEIRDTADTPGASPAELSQKAQVAVTLADTIVIPWAKRQNPSPQEMIAYELMPAQSLLAAQEYQKALERFENIIRTEGKAAASNVDVLQGQAEALFGLKQYMTAAQIYARVIRDREDPSRPAPLYDRAYWNAKMRIYQMMDAQAEGKTNSDIYRGVRRLSNIDKDLGGEPYKTVLSRLRDKHAPR